MATIDFHSHIRRSFVLYRKKINLEVAVSTIFAYNDVQ